MMGAGVARKLVFSWMGNPGVGSLHAIRRRVEHHDPAPLELEEYSHFGMVGRYAAGAANLPFWPLRSYFETDLPAVNPNIRPVTSPFGGEPVYAVPPLHPDVAVVHAQRADAAGNTQIWGLTGCQKEAAFAAHRVIVVVEELVASEVDPVRPQPDPDPRDQGRRGGGLPARRPPLLRPGLLRPRQPFLPGLGRDQPRPEAPGVLVGRVGPRHGHHAEDTWRSWAPSARPS